MVVVLPAPFGPSSANSSPEGMVRSRPSTATLWPYFRVTLSNSIMPDFRDECSLDSLYRRLARSIAKPLTAPLAQLAKNLLTAARRQFPGPITAQVSHEPAPFAGSHSRELQFRAHQIQLLLEHQAVHSHPQFSARLARSAPGAAGVAAVHHQSSIDGGII